MSRHVAMADPEKPEENHVDQAIQDDSSLAPTSTRQTGEKASSYAASTSGLAHKSENAKAERRLLLKLGKFRRFNEFLA